MISTATVVAWSRLNVTLYIRCLSYSSFNYMNVVRFVNFNAFGYCTVLDDLLLTREYFVNLTPTGTLNPSNFGLLFKCLYISQLVSPIRAGRSGDRIPVGAWSSAPVQTGPGAHPVSYTMRNGSFAGIKRPGLGVDHPPHPAPRLKKE